MQFRCRITPLAAGRWQAEHTGADVGNVRSVGGTREEALEKLRGEIRYRLELCPCSGESYQHIEIEPEKE
jgi:hypothetical protein